MSESEEAPRGSEAQRCTYTWPAWQQSPVDPLGATWNEATCGARSRVGGVAERAGR